MTNRLLPQGDDYLNKKVTNPDNLPEEYYQKKHYSVDEVIETLGIYTEVIDTVANARGLGNEILDPTLDVLGMLLEVKEKADSLPPQLRKLFPKPFKELEFYINRCREYKESTRSFLDKTYKFLKEIEDFGTYPEGD